ncbi:MAG TPA: hypothetical protein VFF29_02320 [Bacteroidota bacterium]|nr:hypothetical protein [Bacteroidota bacterium]
MSVQYFRHTLLVVFIVGSSSICSSQWIDDPTIHSHIQKGIDYVYNLSFDSARAEFHQVLQLRPDHPAGTFFLAMVEWWKIIADIDNTSNDERFLSLLEKVIDICDKRLEENEDDLTALFFKGGAVGFRGRLHGNRQDWLNAANDGRIALPIVQQASKLDAKNYDILLGTGIYNYYAEAVPEKYPLVKPLMVFFPKGDRQKGIAQLRLASEKASYANIEATYFLIQLLYNFEKKYTEALPLALKLHQKYPNNFIFHKYVGRCHVALGNWNEMKPIFQNILQRVQEKQFGYGDLIERETQYYLGLYDMNFKNYDSALQHLYRCDELSRTLDKDDPTGFMTMANMKIGMIYDLQIKRDLAILQYKKVMKMDDYQDTHAQAEQYLKTPYSKF